MSNWTLLVNLSLKSTAILAMAWLVTLALHRRSAATRHLVWTAGWTTLLALPLLSISLPGWTHPFANAVLSSGITFHASTVAGEATSAKPATAPVAATSPAPGGPAFDPRRIALVVWSAGMFVALAQMLLAYAAVWRLRRRARPASHDPSALGIDRAVDLFETPHGIPMTAGILRPAIFLPSESRNWSVERLRLVILHELAHISRADAATQLIARTALSLHWWNPLAWFAWREFLKERERAADDLVLGSGACASEYAGHLLEVARAAHTGLVGATAGVAMARRSQLEGRLLAILDSRLNRAQHGRWALGCALVAALTLAAPLATLRAQSQEERQPPKDLDIVFRTASAQKNPQSLEDAASEYEKLRKFAEAQKLREAALAIRKESGDHSPAYAAGLVKLGDLASKQNAVHEAMEFYRRAVAIGDMPETVPALISLGLHAFGENDQATAKDYLLRARNAAKSGNDQGRAMTWLAFVQENNADGAAEVESLYRSAISMEDYGSAEQALSTQLLARFLRAHSRTQEADTLDEQFRTMQQKLASQLSPRMAWSRAISGSGPGGKAPKLLLKIEPQYTEAARAAKLQGTVLLKVAVDVDGLAKNIEVVRSLGMGLDQKAVEAITQWRFEPGKDASGTPVPAQAQIEVNFRLM
jgi:TonB family protein